MSERSWLSGWLIGVLLLVNLMTAMLVIYSTYQTRQLFGELQQLEKVNQQLRTEYGRLLLEESAWSSPGLIEQKARSELKMIEPEEQQIKVLRTQP